MGMERTQLFTILGIVVDYATANPLLMEFCEISICSKEGGGDPNRATIGSGR